MQNSSPATTDPAHQWKEVRERGSGFQMISKKKIRLIPQHSGGSLRRILNNIDFQIRWFLLNREKNIC